MSNPTSNTITACIVVYNEEHIITRCLDSIHDVVDEVIVVHDGVCKDKTLEICRKYSKAKVFTRPHYGAMEGHLLFAYRQASSEWIMRIDADEFLSEDLRKNLRILTRDEQFDAYECLWPLWNGKNYITHTWPYKRCLFRKDKAKVLGILHYIAQVPGQVEKIDFKLEHRPEYDNFTNKAFRKKWLKWARIQARDYLKDFSAIDKFNVTENDWPLQVRLRRSLSLLMIPFDFLITIFKDLRSGAIREGVVGLKVAFMYGAYRATVDYYMFIYRFERNQVV
jgi:glycosyltransferase involved in cell wall biosynthesis